MNEYFHLNKFDRKGETLIFILCILFQLLVTVSCLFSTSSFNLFYFHGSFILPFFLLEFIQRVAKRKGILRNQWVNVWLVVYVYLVNWRCFFPIDFSPSFFWHANVKQTPAQQTNVASSQKKTWKKQNTQGYLCLTIYFLCIQMKCLCSFLRQWLSLIEIL